MSQTRQFTNADVAHWSDADWQQAAAKFELWLANLRDQYGEATPAAQACFAKIRQAYADHDIEATYAALEEWNADKEEQS